MRKDFRFRVFELTKRIPRGRVSTYAEIAAALGKPKAARAVGGALSKNKSKDVPCHRVIASDGTVGGFNRGTGEKIKLLGSEGVRISSGRVRDFQTVRVTLKTNI